MEIDYNINPNPENEKPKKEKTKAAKKLEAEKDVPEAFRKFPKLIGVDQKANQIQRSVTAKTRALTKKAIGESKVVVKDHSRVKTKETIDDLFLDAEKPVDQKKFSELTTEEKKTLTAAKLKALKSSEEGDWWANKNIKIIPGEGDKYDRSVLPDRPGMRINKSCANCKFSVRPYCIKSNRTFCRLDAQDAPLPVEFGLPDVMVHDLRWKDMILYAETVGWYPTQLHLGCDKWEDSGLQVKRMSESITGRAYDKDGNDDPGGIPDYSTSLLRSRIDYSFKVFGKQDQAGNPGEPKTLKRIKKSGGSESNDSKPEKEQ